MPQYQIDNVSVRNMTNNEIVDFTAQLANAYAGSRKNNLGNIIDSDKPKRKCWNFPKIHNDPFPGCQKEITITLRDIATGHIIERVFQEGDPLETRNRSIHITLP